MSTISVIAGLSLYNFYFRLFKGSIKSPQVVEFLKRLVRRLPGRLLLIWDGAAIHRSHLVKDFIASLGDHIVAERLPAYAPELNPAEYIWGYWKNHELPNFCPKDRWNLSFQATRALRRMRRRPKLITAFWKQAELF